MIIKFLNMNSNIFVEAFALQGIYSLILLLLF
jgi:hypothetical protein